MNYIFIAIAAALVALVGLTWLYKNKYVDGNAIQLLISVFGVLDPTLAEIDFKHKKEAQEVLDILQESLAYAMTIATPEIPEADLKNATYVFALTLARKMDEELSATREDLIKKLIDLSFDLGIRKVLTDLAMQEG
jgi:hypothetical protein